MSFPTIKSNKFKKGAGRFNSDLDTTFLSWRYKTGNRLVFTPRE